MRRDAGRRAAASDRARVLPGDVARRAGRAPAPAARHDQVVGTPRPRAAEALPRWRRDGALMDLAHPDRRTRLDELAAQYALGTLRGPARDRFVSAMRSDPAVAAAAREWER